MIFLTKVFFFSTFPPLGKVWAQVVSLRVSECNVLKVVLPTYRSPGRGREEEEEKEKERRNNRSGADEIKLEEKVVWGGERRRGRGQCSK